jgi:hypothetical protein
LRPLIFGLTPFGWLRSICKPLFSDGNIVFIYAFLYAPSFSGRQLERKTGLGVFEI